MDNQNIPTKRFVSIPFTVTLSCSVITISSIITYDFLSLDAIIGSFIFGIISSKVFIESLSTNSTLPIIFVYSKYYEISTICIP